MANDGSTNDVNQGNVEVDTEGNDKRAEQAEVHEEQPNPFAKKGRKRTSHAWNDFDTVTLPDGTKKSQCKFCKQTFYVQASGATTQLLRHLDKCVQRKLTLGTIDKKQKTLSYDIIGSDSMNPAAFTYDHAKVREVASHMILYHEYPFMHMEHVLFNKFMKVVSPHWQKISRTCAKNDVITTFNVQKKKLLTLLKSVNRISITTDLWKSGQKIHYMVVTGHFIDDDWKLQKRVLNFCYVPPPHSGVMIADALYKCITSWGIENKVASITLDNASYNDVALRNLKATFKLLKKKLLFDGKIFHVRCCAHILNLMVQDGISVIGEIVDCVRDGVKYLVLSESSLLQFSEIAKQLQLPSKRLILDCPTRWNSAYMMLSTTLEFKNVFSRYNDRDVGFTYVPSVEEWEKVDRACQFLEIFNDVTNIISGSEYPTSNLFLTEVWRIKEILEKSVEDSEDYVRLMATKMKLKFDKYWGDCDLLMAFGAILDPRYKMVLPGFCFPAIYEDHSSMISMVKENLYELYNDYVAMHSQENNDLNSQQSTTETGPLNSASFGKKVITCKSKYESFIRQSDSIQPVKSDMDIYLEEGVHICPRGMDAQFDALEWWKSNSLKYRILSKMARDILSIPITSMASEATFSAGSRVIDPYRASLATEIVEMLLCGADWVCALYGLKKGSNSNGEEPTHKEFILP